MIKNIFIASCCVGLFASCSSLKSLTAANKAAQKEERAITVEKKPENKFLENIEIKPNDETAASSKTTKAKKTAVAAKENSQAPQLPFGDRSFQLENASPLQLKYAIILNTEVEQLQNNTLLEKLDEWLGTRYRLGGVSKSGVDCSAFVQSVYAGAYDISLPRTAREQYNVATKISRTEIREGDLLFFNTTGGVSHVGIYLQNNKFIHASSSNGVTISDIFDKYYLKRFIAAGRIEHN